MDGMSFEETLRQLDIVFVIDSTGSMGSCISQVQNRLNDFAQKIASASIRPDVAFGVVAYRDHPPEDTTFVTRVYPLSRDLAKVQETVNGLEADGGGDDPEAVLDGLWDALQDSQWRPASHRVMVLVGDAPAHEQCPRELTFPRIIREAKRQEVPIFAVGTSTHTQMIRQFQRLADGTGGLFVRLDDIGRLIEKILSLLEQTVIVDMEVSLAVYNRRMQGMSPAEIAKQIGRPESEVQSIIRSLEAKGAKWPAVVPPAVAADRAPAAPKTPVVGTIPISTPASEPSHLVPKPLIVPIANLSAEPTYQVRWMGWQAAQAYELEEAPDPAFAQGEVAYTGTDTSWTAERQPQGTHYYRVRIRDALGNWGVWSDVQKTIVS